MNLELKNPIIVALDVDTAEAALHFAKLLHGRVGAVKLGPRLLVRYGQTLVQKMSELAPVFIDNKYFDIPSTMEAAVRASFEVGATLVTVHALSGSQALQKLAALERNLNAIRPFRVLCVTILTSFSQEGLPFPLNEHSIEHLTSQLSQLCLDSGLNGWVCSPHEVQKLRDLDPRSYLVTPGVRLPQDGAGDQSRVLTPKQAIRQGASALVIGRPIIEAKDPIAKVEEILADLESKL